MKYLAVFLSSTILVACGGGGGGGPDASASPSSTVSSSASSSTAASPASAQVAKYEGVWRQDCDNHMRLTRTATATGGTTFSIVTKEEYFDNADCTGALVATGGFGQANETVQYMPTLANASVTLLTGEIIISDVDPATSVSGVAAFTFTGSGVASTYYVSGKTLTHIVYTNGYADILRDVPNGQTTLGALLLRNGELLSLVPIGASTTSFKVNRRYIR